MNKADLVVVGRYAGAVLAFVVLLVVVGWMVLSEGDE